MINDILFELVNISETNIKKCLSEEMVIDYADKYGLSISEMSKLTDDLVTKGVRLVSSSEYEEAIKQTPIPESNIDEEVENLVKLYLKLPSEKRIMFREKLKSLDSSLVSESDKKSSEFIDRIERAYLQYSYIAVFLRSFFEICDNNGTASLEKLTDKFKDYYMQRLLSDIIAEKPDSKLSRFDFNQSDVKSLIISNPLKRSFLKNYYSIDRKNDIVSIDKSVWRNIDQKKKNT